ncbi:MAG: hypothetical protein IPL46_14930 [Saprospiraceae bacterium]|nr:hypothetical protein [Saprospiraceae bacterium]
MRYISLLAMLPLLLPSCDSITEKVGSARAVPIHFNQDDEWRDHWYDGNAEVNVYETKQARYQDIHPGKTVLIFVTEDFLSDKQVKNENYSDKTSTSVLKTNLIRKFDTGVYDYSIMTSVFTPVDHKAFPKTLKITTSSQDWCGQSFMQLNHEQNKYRVRQYSYFEKEGDQNFTVDDLMNEDEIFNQIRFDPDLLPTGSKNMLPGTAFSRLKHIEFKSYPVTLTKDTYTGTDFTGKNPEVYKIVFPDFDRTLEIIYESKFPFQILGWTDTYAALSGEKLTSISKMISSKRMPYWSKHNLEDSHLRAEIGL